MDPLERFPTLRQSRLAAYDRCPRQASLEEEHGRGWSDHLQANGQIFHRFAAKCLQAMAEHGEETIGTGDALAVLYECLRQHDVEDRDLVAIPLEQVADLRWMAIKFANDNRWDIANLVDVEQRLEATLRYGKVERRLTGQLDALFVVGADDEHAIIIDWKSGWGLPPASGVSFGGYFQQRFYAWLVMRNYPSVFRVTLREFYARTSQPREASVTRNDLEDMEAELAALAERFDRSEAAALWPPSPGKHCSYCIDPVGCPIYPGARGEGMILSPEHAQQVGEEALVAEAAFKQRQKAIKVWTNDHGALPIKTAKGERQWGHVAHPRVERPTKEKLEQALADAGANVDVASLYKETTQTRFEQHAPTAPPEPDPAADERLEEALRESIRRAKEAKDG